MKHVSRRGFLKTAAAGTMLAGTGAALQSCQQSASGKKTGGQDRLKFGMASYTFRNFNLADTLAMTSRLGLSYIAFKSFHLPLDASTEEIQNIAQQVKDAGLRLYGCGVVYMKNEAEVNNAFEYAKTAGMKTIIGVPEHHLLELVNQKVQEYDIQVAIHNHGPGDERYPSPESVYEKVKGLDPRIGLCMDIGHTKRIGLDPSAEARRFADRLLDVHIKDVTAAEETGSTIEIGRGVIDIPEFLATLLALNYQGIVSFEFEKDKQDPLPGVAESVGYVRGVMDVI